MSVRGLRWRYALVLACVVLAACAGILGLKRKTSATFPHRAHVTAGVSCTRCHTNVGDGKPILHLPDDASCTSCHKKPHDSHPCLECHIAPNAIGELTEARDHLKFDHSRHLKRTQNNCMRCHDGIASGDEHIRPPMATCFKCHQGDAERDGRRCDTCHRDLPGERTLPASHLAHDGDWLHEHGVRAASSGELCETCHTVSYCASCHGQTVPALPAARRFADPFAASAHRAGFVSRHSLEARSDPGACATCHQPTRCFECHQERGVATRDPHPPGWVGLARSDNLHGREARRDPAACAACHGGAGESLCVSCHSVGGVGGNPHPPGWRSRLPMSAMPCRMCHPIGAR